LVSIAEVHAIVAGAQLAQSEPEVARDRFGFLERHGFVKSSSQKQPLFELPAKPRNEAASAPELPTAFSRAGKPKAKSEASTPARKKLAPSSALPISKKTA